MGAVVDATASVGIVSNGSVHHVELPEHWNGRFIVLFTDRSMCAQSDSNSHRVRLAWQHLVSTGYVVAEVDGRLVNTSSHPSNDNHLLVHLVLSMGFPEGAYLVGASLGAEIALITVVIDDSGRTVSPDVVSPGFVPAGQEGFSVASLEETLESDEQSAKALSYRLQTNRSDLAHTLFRYYSLLSDLHRSRSGYPCIPEDLNREAGLRLSGFLQSVS
ncbi:MAG: hypothetical protein EA403_16880 [Spirochaetaceae bacterium]|nr:MAG: hypothetical protein EA403_16880 [Spirochaetaceae bacterium]